MFETKFYINGRQVSKQDALKHWLSSSTYKNSASNTRDQIWRIAITGDDSGNHNPDGEVTYLEEAGITLSA